MRRLQDGIDDDADEAENASKKCAGRCDNSVGQLSPPQPHQNGNGGRGVEDVGQQEEADDIIVLHNATFISAQHSL